LSQECPIGREGAKPICIPHDHLGHASIATTGRYVATNLRMKRDALKSSWKHAGIADSRSKQWSPTPDLLAHLNSL
jgi:hypothetical protein